MGFPQRRSRWLNPLAGGIGVARVLLDNFDSEHLLAQTNISWSFTVSTGARRFLSIRLGLFTSDGTYPNSAFFNGVLMELSGQSAVQNGLREIGFYLVNPPVGTYNFTTTLPSSMDVTIKASSWFNVDQATPVEAVQNTSGQNSAPTDRGFFFTTSLQNSVAITSFTFDDTSTAATSSQTELANEVSAGGSSGLSYLGSLDVPFNQSLFWTNLSATANFVGYGFIIRPSLALTDNVMGGSPGSFTLAGIVANVLATRKLTAADASYAETGPATGVLVARKLSADVGSLALTGNAANLGNIRTINAITAEYQWTGRDANLLGTQRRISAATGQIIWTGNDASLRYNKLAAETGSYILGFLPATLTRGRILAAAAATYAWTGVAANTLFGHKFSATSQTYVIAGQVATLVRNRILTAAAGSFVESGQAAVLAKGVSLSAAVGSFVVTGQDATPKYGRLMAAAGYAYVLSASDVGLTRTIVMPAAAGSFSHTGQAATLRYDHPLVATTGVFEEVGIAAALKAAHLLTITVGSLTETGVAASFGRTWHLVTQTGTFTETCPDALLKYGNKFVATAGSIAWTGPDAALLARRLLTAAAGTLTETGQDATLKALRKIVADTKALHLEGEEVGLAIGGRTGHMLRARLVAAPRIHVALGA